MTTLRSAWPRPGRVTLTLAGVLLGAYVLELVLLRAGVDVLGALALVPAEVAAGQVWRVATYTVLHAPNGVGHLLFNLLTLVMFGGQLERVWGPRRLLLGYAVAALGGGLLTLAVGLAGGAIGGAFASLAVQPHIGASGATTGLTLAWGLVHADREVMFAFLPPMRGRTFVIGMIIVELLVALSYDAVSSTSHLGGMAAAALFTTGAWRPSVARGLLRRRSLQRKKRALEVELRVIQGGRGKPDDDLLN
jgi:membrane associated rhomboid family serine protease